MSEIIQKDGVDIEVFTADELQAQKDAALEEYKKANPNNSEEVTKLQTDLKAKEEELLKMKDKDMNFGNLRQSIKEKEDEIKKLSASMDEKIGNVKKEVLEGVLSDYKTDVLNKLANGDKELLAKIEFQYKRLSDPAATKEEINKKLNDSFVLATGKSIEAGIGQAAFSSGGAGPLKVDKNPAKLSDEEKKMAVELANAGGMPMTMKDLEGK